MWKSKECGHNVRISDLLHDTTFFSAIRKMLTYYQTVPPTTCTVERSFITLCYVKTWLRCKYLYYNSTKRHKDLWEPVTHQSANVRWHKLEHNFVKSTKNCKSYKLCRYINLAIHGKFNMTADALGLRILGYRNDRKWY